MLNSNSDYLDKGSGKGGSGGYSGSVMWSPDKAEVGELPKEEEYKDFDELDREKFSSYIPFLRANPNLKRKLAIPRHLFS